MRPTGPDDDGLGWLLDEFVERVPPVQHAVVLSVDGLLLGAGGGLDRTDAEHLAAVASGFQSLARSAGRRFGGGAARQTVIELESAYLLVTAAGSGACLAVLTVAEADIGLVAYEMALLVKRVGSALSTTRRTGPTEAV